jgi:hypothetical protein
VAPLKTLVTNKKKLAPFYVLEEKGVASDKRAQKIYISVNVIDEVSGEH